MSWLLILLFLLAAGCSSSTRPENSITLATTTSTQDSGLLDFLVPMFKEQSGIDVKVVAVGTGQALELGRRGDADLLMVHDPESEAKFMAEGYGAERRPLMYNDFVLLGPKNDPAGVKEAKSVAEAFARIAAAPSPFVSRGDESGTHQKEKRIWRLAKVEPQGDWYISAGTGMGHVLRMASQKRAYTLSDRATFLALREGLDLQILFEGDPLLLNRYSIILISTEKHPHLHHQAAQKFRDFLLSPHGQKAIADFGKDRYGQPLFFTGEPGESKNSD
jgi:tungstate transport system substrate-binding protein